MKQKGFTLIELMIVVGIIAVLTAIAVPNFGKYIRKSKMTRAESDIAQIEQALAMFEADHGKYPDDFKLDHDYVNPDKPYAKNADGDPKEWVRCLTTRIQDPVSGNKYGPYLPKGIPLDPWGNEYHCFKRLTGRNNIPTNCCTMDTTDIVIANEDGTTTTFSKIFDFATTDPDSINDTAKNYVGCGQKLEDGEDAKNVWAPPPADRSLSASEAQDQNAGLAPYYIFSIGQNLKPGEGDDVTSWDSERRWKRSYE